jgi:hypothetical protein
MILIEERASRYLTRLGVRIRIGDDGRLAFYVPETYLGRWLRVLVRLTSKKQPDPKALIG